MTGLILAACVVACPLSMLAMMLMMLVFWGVAIVAVVLGLRWLAGQGETSPSDRALEILRERYARGEINAQEFEAKRRDLQGTR